MVPRRSPGRPIPARTRRPLRRTRAYRLARTAVLAVSLVAGCIWWSHTEESGDAAVTASPDSPGTPVAAQALGDPADGHPAPGEPPAAGVRGSGGTDVHGVGNPEQGDQGDGTEAGRAERGSADSSGAGKDERGPGDGSGAGKSEQGPDADGTAREAGSPARSGERPAASPRPAPPAARPDPTRPAPSARPSSPRPLPPSRATRLAVPYLDIDAPVMGLRLDRDRRLPAPPDDDANLVGWYEGGPSPGAAGTAVAVGHLDTDRGPAVFAGLSEMKRGRRVEVRRVDGRTAVYTVDAVKSYDKEDFPNEEVYGDRGRPELRLITCGGNYDRRKGYSGNIVVYAHLTAVRASGAK